MTDYENAVEIRDELRGLNDRLDLLMALMARIAARDTTQPMTHAKFMLKEAESLRMTELEG